MIDHVLVAVSKIIVVFWQVGEPGVVCVCMECICVSMDSALSQASFMAAESDSDSDISIGLNGAVKPSDAFHLAKIVRNHSKVWEVLWSWKKGILLAILALHGIVDLVGGEIRPQDACPKDRQEHSSLERLVTVVEDTIPIM